MTDLNSLRVAALATHGVEESELLEPMKALREAGATVDVIAPEARDLQTVRHMDKASTCPVDATLDEARPDGYDALLLPGGALNADFLRADPRALSFIRTLAASGKPIAAICHAPWELISAGLAMGRTMTGYHTVRDDVRNAGANWVDREVAIDGNLVTSRQPSDLPAFNRAMIEVFSHAAHPAA